MRGLTRAFFILIEFARHRLANSFPENHIPVRLGRLKAVLAPSLRVGLLHAGAVLKQTP